jgi:hypothetical protein
LSRFIDGEGETKSEEIGKWGDELPESRRQKAVKEK